MSFIEASGLKKSYNAGYAAITALDGVDFAVEKGAFALITGPLGAGKTTLLNIVGGMDRCDGGTLTVDGEDITKYGGRQLSAYRRFDIGFVSAKSYLMPNLTIFENIELAAQMCKNPVDPMRMLMEVGLSERSRSFPDQLSEGEQRRISIAVALSKNPKIFVCDDPLAGLDDDTGRHIISVLINICRERGMTMLASTHNNSLAAAANRVIRLKDGRVSKIYDNPEPAQIDSVDL